MYRSYIHRYCEVCYMYILVSSSETCDIVVNKFGTNFGVDHMPIPVILIYSKTWICFVSYIRFVKNQFRITLTGKFFRSCKEIKLGCERFCRRNYHPL